ncbi:phage/plasmid primase, P4 family [Roseomonas fluvialis]|nr:phage/plasmid primase, P4 family [Roseomonas fluvialis]
MRDIAALPVWVAWREDTTQQGRSAKVPYHATAGERASATDPGTWGTRPQAEHRARPGGKLLRGGRKGGIGLVLGPLPAPHDVWVLGFDLDSSRDATTGCLEPWAQDVVNLIPSRWEVSPSQTGVKSVFTVAAADMPAILQALGLDAGKQRYGRQWRRGRETHGPAIELYCRYRYFTVTGAHVAGTPEDIGAVPLDAILHVIRVAGPGLEGPRQTDRSRSGRAFGIACRIHRDMGSRADFEKAVAEDDELAAWAVDAREVDRAWRNSEGQFAPTEDGVALAFAAWHADDLRYCHETGEWLVWTGSRWASEKTRLAFDWARGVTREIGGDKNGRAAFVSGVERFAQADRNFATTVAALDRDPWLLGTPGGTVDLRTGIMRVARQEDFITKHTAVEPHAAEGFDPDLYCPVWMDTLRQVTLDDTPLIDFLQQWFGYSLSGDTREQRFVFIHGEGGNGKGIIANTIGDVLGDYCTNIAPETLTVSSGERHSTDIARLRGARMARSSETEEGKRWAENLIKGVTGGDVMTARLMRQDNFEFKPQFKLTVIGNNKPSLSKVDEAMRRRIIVIPFLYKPENPDRTLAGRLRAEWPGILRWVIEGCLAWQRHGLIVPPIATQATETYFVEQDRVARWIAECCETGPDLKDTRESLFESWQQFERDDGTRPAERTGLGELMTSLAKRGFPEWRTKGARRGRRGIRAHTSTHADPNPWGDGGDG